jgi:hypothetical protein
MALINAPIVALALRIAPSAAASMKVQFESVTGAHAAPPGSPPR